MRILRNCILGLAIGFLLYYINPDFSLENVAVSSVTSIMGETAAASSAQMPTETSKEFYKTQFKTDKSQFEQAPEFSQATGFMNANSTKLADFKGKVVLIHFWTYTCINCIHTIPFLNEWYQKYADNGFVIVGIHTPEFEFEKNIDNVKKAINEFEIKYPVIQDNNYEIWNAYGNKYWPRDYLIDKEGYIRYNHIGEGGYNQTENMIQSLIQEPQTNLGVNGPAKPIA